MRIDYNPDGRWPAVAVQTRYIKLRGRIRLFRTLGVEPYRRQIERYARSPKAYIQRAARRLLS